MSNENQEFSELMEQKIEVEKIKTYILDSRENVSPELAEKVAKSLSESNIKYIQVKNGDCEKLITSSIEYHQKYALVEDYATQLSANSVKKPEERSVKNSNNIILDIKFETKKKKSDIYKKIISVALSVAGLISVVLYVGEKVEEVVYNIDSVSTMEDVKQDLAEKTGINIDDIVDNNKVKTFNSDDEPVNIYDHTEIAADIISKCRNNPELLGITLHDVYSDLSKDGMSNMDKVFASLKYNTQNDHSLLAIYEQIADCEVFLEYLIKAGYVGKSSPYYDELPAIITHIKVSGRYDTLDYKEKQMLDDIMDEYKYSKGPYLEIADSFNLDEEPTTGGRK